MATRFRIRTLGIGEQQPIFAAHIQRLPPHDRDQIIWCVVEMSSQQPLVTGVDPLSWTHPK